MGQISRFLRQGVGGRLYYWCQGCEEIHGIRTAGSEPWGYNGNPDKPTFTPSVLVTYPANPEADPVKFPQWLKERRCHTFVTEGMVQFLGDCTHALAGQTLPLPELPEHLRDPA